MAFALSGEFVTRKIGPLPTWAWGGLVLLAALVWKSVTANREAEKKKKDEQPGGDPYGYAAAEIQQIGGNQRPPIVFQNYVTSITPGLVPPGGGRTGTPSAPPVTAPTEKPGSWVTVSKWTWRDPPWNSTVYGIAKKMLGTGDSWQAIWNHPENQQLKERRKKPEQIQPGDKIFVPAPVGTSPVPVQDPHSGSWHSRRRD